MHTIITEHDVRQPMPAARLPPSSEYAASEMQLRPASKRILPWTTSHSTEEKSDVDVEEYIEESTEVDTEIATEVDSDVGEMGSDIGHNFSSNKTHPMAAKRRLTEKEHPDSTDMVISSDESSDEFESFEVDEKEAARKHF